MVIHLVENFVIVTIQFCNSCNQEEPSVHTDTVNDSLQLYDSIPFYLKHYIC